MSDQPEKPDEEEQLAKLRRQRPTRAEFIAELEREGIRVTTFGDFLDKVKGNRPKKH